MKSIKLIIFIQQNMSEWFRNTLPQPIRFFISGGIGSYLFYLLNELILKTVSIPYQPITVAFFIAYFISIFLQYFLHTYLVFGPGGDFIKGVISCYAGYSTALFSSAPINYGLVNYLNFNASQAWLGSLIITGVANYFLLTFLMGGEKKTKEDEDAKRS